MVAILLREPRPYDLPFVLSSWMQSHREEGANALMDNDAYFAAVKPRLIEILSRSPVLVASNPEDPWQVYGWIAAEPDVLHYVYVKSVYRKFGIGRQLFDAVGRPSQCTHTGWMFPKLKDSWGLRYIGLEGAS